MLAGETVLAVIPARGGSKRVPRKNLRSLGGKLSQLVFGAEGRMLVAVYENGVVSVRNLPGGEPISLAYS